MKPNFNVSIAPEKDIRIFRMNIRKPCRLEAHPLCSVSRRRRLNSIKLKYRAHTMSSAGWPAQLVEYKSI